MKADSFPERIVTKVEIPSIVVEFVKEDRAEF